ncbi:MAG TPA: hypothetical protein PLE54_17410 [Burkholderiaceae bacterium]|nr:hypothetical protein [Burkholderiaceae bacterium]
MDGSLVYSKTPKGVAEIAARSAQLSMTTRRVLIMIDGKRSIDDLAVLLRPGEIDAVVAQLEGAGLIQRASSSAALDVPTIAGRVVDALPTTQGPGPATGEEPNPMTLEEAKRRAVRELTDRLGPEAETVALRIESCRTIEDFRERVREAERFVTAVLGAAAAADYLRALRRR